MGLGYRWLLDFAGPLDVTPRATKYILVMVEHFSKIECVALPQNSAKMATTTFIDHVLACFEALIEVLTDQGRKFISAITSNPWGQRHMVISWITTPTLPHTTHKLVIPVINPTSPYTN